MAILRFFKSNLFVAKKGRIFECFWPQKKVIYFEFSLLFSPYNGIIYI